MYIYGKNTVLESVNSNKNIKKIYLAKENVELFNKIKKNLDKKNEIVLLPSNVMIEKFGKGCQGIAAEIEEYRYIELKKLIDKNKEKENVAMVILDSLEDPHNLGAIMRTADATNMDGIIIPKNRSVSLNSTVAKVSTGAIEHIDVAQVTNLVQAINLLKENGYWIIGLDMDGSVDYREQDFNGKIAVIIGSEGNGISRLVKEKCDFYVHIPMYGHVNSLNASVSASIIFYEIVRGRNN